MVMMIAGGAMSVLSILAGIVSCIWFLVGLARG
jgi:hypothetical protein